MMTDSTSASSGLTTRSRSVSVFDGAICSSGMSSPVVGSRWWAAGGGQPVLDQAVVADLQDFLNADAGQAQYFHGGPGPERQVLFHGQVAPFPCGRVVHPDLPAGRARGH
jgi:hypothetical protein